MLLTNTEISGISHSVTTIAFFDLDYTLLDTSSGWLYLQEIIRQRRAPLWAVGSIGLRYQIKQLDSPASYRRQSFP